MEKKKKRKKSRKPKVMLNRKQVIILTLAIVAVCICMLCATILTMPSTPNSTNSVTEVIISKPTETKKVETKIETKSTENKVVEKKEATQPKEKVTTEANKTTKTEQEKTISQPQKTETKKTSTTTKVEQKTTSAKTEVTQKIEDAFANVPVAKNNAVLVVVLDDGGQNLSHLQPFLDLAMPLDIAVLPALQYSVESAKRVRNAGKELMLHQPMQAKNLNVNPGPNAITPEMHTYDIEQLVRKNISEIGPVAGLNNHEGSLITESASKIGAVLDVCMAENIFFLDSRTTAATKGPQSALERGIHIWERDIFLDNTQVREDIISQIVQATKIANRDGYAIMIGHVWSSSNLAKILSEMYVSLSKKGYRFSTVGGLYENFGY